MMILLIEEYWETYYGVGQRNSLICIGLLSPTGIPYNKLDLQMILKYHMYTHQKSSLLSPK